MAKIDNKQGKLVELQGRFQEILDAETGKSIKDTRLAVLMTDVEKVFEIPLMAGRRLESFKEQHADVFEFYQKVSRSRVLDA
ncbi:hypothetical protein [Halobacillus salinus]|uniref:hypothetical protein n=1 Tax=Halobacillus salinus TaxID=192814 RepID=UPI0009A566AB|nr:hypothetical protein [Halobacillus salinus]